VQAFDPGVVKRVDAALEPWRQGDVALDEDWFVHVGDPGEPLTEAAADAEGPDLQALTSMVAGLTVVTQTCDVVRSCTDRPYLEVAPLAEVAEHDMPAIEHGHRPVLAVVPSVRDRRLVADLDRVMTIEKAVAARWTRTPGCTGDAERRAFALALARKRARFAFPDDFADCVGKLVKRLVDKHSKQSDEGAALRRLREIRVLASPSWEAGAVGVMLWFIRNEEDIDYEGTRWDELLVKWLGLLPTTGRFDPIDGAVVTLEDMTAAEYVASDPVDLDRLSGAPR